MPVSELVVRRLLVDLETPLPRHWCGGDAFRTAFLNALSMSFPLGEQFFLDAVRQGAAVLPPAERERWQAEVQGFVGQEATHRRVHGLFNAHLERQGLVNRWAERAARRIERLRGLDARHALAATAAYEHFTAILAEHLLAHPGQLGDVEPRLLAMWLWHAAEECEHRSVAFDLYRALGGDERRRLRWFRIASVYFVVDVARQTLHNLWRDGTLWQPATWSSAARFLFGGGGLVRECFTPWRAYFRADFHPAQGASARGRAWLDAHAGTYAPLGR